MEEVVVRARYPRRSITKRVKKRGYRNNLYVNDTLKRQISFSIIVLLFVVLIKSINTPVTNFVTDKIKSSVSYNMDINSIYTGINDFIDKVSGKKPESLENDGFQERALPVSAGSYISESSTAKSGEKEGIVIEDTSENTKKVLFIVPAEGTLGSPYGERLDPFLNTTKFHKGIDIEAAKNAPIRAALSGEVLEAGTEKTYGNYIKLKHSDGIMTVYAHCNQLLVKKGQKVQQGDVIAKVGNTGSSVGAHLHFEIWKNDRTVDPEDYINVAEK